jgi:hypothetical protein
METSLIEEVDKSRYSMIKWCTLGWIVWYGTFIINDLINNKFVVVLLLVIGLVGWVFFMINLVRLIKLGKKINLNSELKEALSNEMHQFYVLKSMTWGFWATMATVCIFIIISLFYKLSALIVCEFILFVGVSTILIANLVYNKE